MNWLRKLCSIVLAVSLLPLLPVRAAEDDPAAVFDAVQPSATRMDVRGGVSGAPAVTAERAGKTGWLAQTSVEDGAKNIYCNVDDGYLYNQPDGAAVEIIVEYFDGEAGLFSISYDSIHNSYGSEPYVTPAAMPVELTGTNTWKTHVFRIYDARFANQLSGADFVIQTYGSGAYYNLYYQAADIVFGSVTVKKIPLVATLDTGCDGNIFFGTGTRTVAVSLENTTANAVSTAAVYTVVSQQTGAIVWNSSQIFQLAPFQISQRLLTIPVPEYGLYTLRVDTEAAGDVTATTREFAFSAVVENGSAVRDERFGVGVHAWDAFWGGTYPDTLADLVTNSGSGWVRNDLNWQDYETARGVYRIPEAVMASIDATLERGMQMIMPLHGTNTNYSSDTSLPLSETELQAFEEFCCHIAADLKGKVEVFETWNEYPPASTQTAVTEYVKLLKATYEGVKRGNPDAVVVGFDTAGTPVDWWMRPVAEAGGLAYMDAVSVHPYDTRGDPDPDTADLVGRMRQVKALLEEFDAEKEIWITEIGWSNTRNRHNTGNVTEDFSPLDSAVYLIKAYVHCIGQDVADKVLFYDFMNDNHPYGIKEANFGMIESRYPEEAVPFAAKPAYAAASFMTRMLHDAAPAGVTEETNLFRYAFDKSDGSRCEVIWHCQDSGTVSLTLPVGGTTVIYDMYGNQIASVENQGQLYRQALDGEPVYVQYFSEGYIFEPSVAYSVGETGEEITINAKLPEALAGVDVSLHVMRTGASFDALNERPMEAAVYVGQGQTDTSGQFADTFRVPHQEGLYTAYLAFAGYPGRYRLDMAVSDGFASVLAIAQNGRPAAAFDRLDRTAPLEVYIKGAQHTASDAVLVCAFYQNGALSGLQTMEVQMTGGAFAQQMTIPGPLNDGRPFDSLRIMLWDGLDRLTCLAESVGI